MTSPRRVCIAPATVAPITGYRSHGCRCYTCSTASANYESGRRAAVAEGTWQPRVDASPVIEHLRTLRAANVGPARIAQAAGVSLPRVIRYLSDTNRPFPKRIGTVVASALLGVTVAAAGPNADRVPALGSRRRARALSALGWSMADQAARLGIPPHSYTSSINRRQVSVRRARQVADLYEQLSGTPGPSGRARDHAMRKRWAPPLAWDDVDIDDPAARPSRTGRRKNDTRTYDSTARKAA